jgi:NitT/TauT family transport system permease protein/putative hydroxymethylpyrimidine transport system permease protein
MLLALLGAWELYVDLGGADPLILPAPHAIAQSLYSDHALLWSNLLFTAGEVLLGILAGVAAAFVLSVAIHFSQVLRRALYPLLVASQTLPIPIVAPVLVLWLGFGLGPKVLMVALVSFFPVVVTTSAALEGVDPELLKLMRTFDATRARSFSLVELPSALPGLFTGARIAAVVAVIGAVFAEWAGSNRGLGYLFNNSMDQLLIPRAYACVVLLSVFAIVLFAALGVLERLALPWAPRARDRESA